jgi:hypothetical protein
MSGSTAPRGASSGRPAEWRAAVRCDARDPAWRSRNTVPAEGEREIDVKARAQSVALLRQLADAEFSYQVDGKLLLDNAEADEVEFDHTTRLGLD